MGMDKQTAIKLEAEEMTADPSPATRPNHSIAIALMLPKTDPKHDALRKHNTKKTQNGGIPFHTNEDISNSIENIEMPTNPPMVILYIPNRSTKRAFMIEEIDAGIARNPNQSGNHTPVS